MPPPVIRTPITDMFPSPYSHQTYGTCMNFEDRFLQCSEAYGQKLSLIKCKDFEDDLVECNSRAKQLRRVHIMAQERQRQIKNGERPAGKEYMETPKLNSYGGTFFGHNN